METKRELNSYIGNGIPYLKSQDFKLGDVMRYRVLDAVEESFGDPEHPKMMLVMVGTDGNEVGLVLNRTNLNFLKEGGITYFEELYGKIVTVSKEARVVEFKTSGKNQSQETIGLFIKALDEDKVRRDKNPS